MYFKKFKLSTDYHFGVFENVIDLSLIPLSKRLIRYGTGSVVVKAAFVISFTKWSNCWRFEMLEINTIKQWGSI